MTIRNLDALFKPSSVAIIGATERAGALGQLITRNVLDAGFPGPVWLVNPHRATLFEHRCFPDVASLPAAPELAIITTPAAAAVDAVAALAARGTRAAVVIAAGFAGSG
ncbi:MAG: CoA-binding protein, partial [Gammaproteobacteria bacterium]|nr:CoA-binding protein [Gammaproteobacteria bacterium]